MPTNATASSVSPTSSFEDLVKEARKGSAYARTLLYDRMKEHLGTPSDMTPVQIHNMVVDFVDRKIGDTASKRKPGKLWEHFTKDLPTGSKGGGLPFSRFGAWAGGLGFAANYMIDAASKLTGGFWNSAGQLSMAATGSIPTGVCGMIVGFGTGLVFDSALFGIGLFVYNTRQLLKEYFSKDTPASEKKSILRDVRFWSGIGYAAGAVVGGIFGVHYATMGLGLIKELLAPFQNLTNMIDLVRSTFTEFVPAYAKTALGGLLGFTAGALGGAACGAIPGVIVGVGRKVANFFGFGGSTQSQSSQTRQRTAGVDHRAPMPSLNPSMGQAAQSTNIIPAQAQANPASERRGFIGSLSQIIGNFSGGTQHAHGRA